MTAIPEKLSASLEDYLEAILHLSDNGNVARSKDIAQALDVAKPSVTAALKTLSEKGLVNYKRYGFVTLTENGKEHASRVAVKHEVLKSFFVDILGVPELDASQAACKVEHALDRNITKRLISFMQFVSDPENSGCDISAQFKKYFNRQNS